MSPLSGRAWLGSLRRKLVQKRECGRQDKETKKGHGEGGDAVLQQVKGRGGGDLAAPSCNRGSNGARAAQLAEGLLASTSIEARREVESLEFGRRASRLTTGWVDQSGRHGANTAGTREGARRHEQGSRWPPSRCVGSRRRDAARAAEAAVLWLLLSRKDVAGLARKISRESLDVVDALLGCLRRLVCTVEALRAAH